MVLWSSLYGYLSVLQSGSQRIGFLFDLLTCLYELLMAVYFLLKSTPSGTIL